jgi:organic hydroperoxide reductase OsmC/OhrA
VSKYTAIIRWQRGQDSFSDNSYSRAHDWEFDGGAIVAASASPDIVPPPLSVEENVDPEEAFVASIASCHMLFFLSLAAKRGYVVDHYVDNASGTMEVRADGKTAMTRVVLRPHAQYSGDKMPAPVEVTKMHHQAHDLCFIANSVNTVIDTEIVA